MSKHAYLIIAHKCWDQLALLIRLLDDPRNDIFLHIDKKSLLSEEDKKMIMKSASFSQVNFVPRVSVEWGGYSIVNAEMSLLGEATGAGRYDYYHLLSGQDLPIKTQDYIHSFFEKHHGKECVMFGSNKWITDVMVRLKYYWLLQNYAGGSKRFDKAFLRGIDHVSIWFQKKLGVNRIDGFEFSAGAQWFSITDQFARSIVAQKAFVQKHFRYTNCSDECLIQIMGKKLKIENRLYSDGGCNDYGSILRLIDWKRGTPYVFRSEDFDAIMESDCLFARKFDYGVDSRIINQICDFLLPDMKG